ncbi:unnamed protein product [Rhizophagus irregularis]|nr:unnamed protein product [Rhizophagus irregularis]
MVYRKLNKRPKRSKNKIEKGFTVKCNYQSCSLSPNRYKEVLKVIRTRHRMPWILQEFHENGIKYARLQSRNETIIESKRSRKNRDFSRINYTVAVSKQI